MSPSLLTLLRQIGSLPLSAPVTLYWPSTGVPSLTPPTTSSTSRRHNAAVDTITYESSAQAAAILWAVFLAHNGRRWRWPPASSASATV